MPASLIPIGESSGKPFRLDKPIILIGRHPDCDLFFKDSRKISRRHCCIVQVNSTYILRDLGSMNGVKVNDKRHVETPLKEGDELLIGEMRFRFSYKPAEKNPAVDKATVDQGPVKMDFEPRPNQDVPLKPLEDRETPLVKPSGGDRH